MTNLNAQNFAEIANAAARDAIGSRQELGRACAIEFSANPDKFDPKKLMLLGRPGLRAFAEVMGVAIADVTPNTSTADAPPAHGKESGWSGHEARGISFELTGMLVGACCGIVLIAAASLAAWFNM